MMGFHGGDLEMAMMLCREAGFEAGARTDWLDLSTGINPRSYPVGELPPAIWHRLPEKAAHAALIEAAAAYYGAPSPRHLVAAGGSALLIQLLPLLAPDKPVFIVAPTYGDHEAAWQRETSGKRVRLVADLEMAEPGAISLLVNPNNPDGRVTSFETMADFARRAKVSGGLLIVDEAFGDGVDGLSATSLVADHPVIILKSLGKFFGLAGLRVGFAIAPLDSAARLSALLGSWPLSGPALHIATRALTDKAWQRAMRDHLAARSAALIEMLARLDLPRPGGTHLFTLIDTPAADRLFTKLLAHRIYVRRFAYNANWLRVGVPENADDLARLERALKRA